MIDKERGKRWEEELKTGRNKMEASLFSLSFY